ncbi:molybdopterin molybdotransferase MoeA [Aquimarina intermedia]|uniref:Molybdopterin molybdenumtransferase n=1 Tax=Aquimarina intermedia TaxID=350814 RepID=A0A5S5C7F4_9FLAO|nr:gephyrin-like molybdotransferase Glp [Aquimarina intermedia]TYP74326.1 molybdopterin molybdochelatase [Aquimarina intermedia]
MIKVEEARKLILTCDDRVRHVMEVSLEDALGYSLAEDIISLIDMPPFRQSSMDGYAINIGDSSNYKVIGEIKAGDNHDFHLTSGEAVRIYTGAPVPDTSNAVLIQEKIEVEDDQIFTEETPDSGMNIRPIGEQIRKDELALKAGVRINSAHIGFISSVGVNKVKVYSKPSIAIVVTGNELVTNGLVLPYGKVYESNGPMLRSMLASEQYNVPEVIRVEDNYESTIYTLGTTISDNDVVIITGGISVGKYDFVGRALKNLNVQEIFYKVNQKPGKPLFYGKKGNTSIFALPGNPAAALTCFYIYVYPLLKTLEGASKKELNSLNLSSLSNYNSKETRAQFLKAVIQEDGVQILGGQSSAMLSAFGEANALIFLPENTFNITKGDKVKTILLPW